MIDMLRSGGAFILAVVVTFFAYGIDPCSADTLNSSFHRGAPTAGNDRIVLDPAAAVRIDNDDYSKTDLRHAVNAAGDVMAVWRQYSGSIGAWANRFTMGQGWGTAEMISDGTARALDPVVATDSKGRAVATWTQSADAMDDLYANTYSPGEGWGAPVVLEDVDTGYVAYNQVSMNSSGFAVAVWCRCGDYSGDILAMTYKK